jgi:iron complex outermembrane recepter protein
MKIVLVVSLLLSSILFADESPSQDELEVLLVTARKRVEDAQKIPFSLSSLGEADLRDGSKQSLRELTHIVPSFNIVGPPLGRYSTAYIRGLGNQDLSLPDDVSVNFYLDEVPLPRYAFDLDLFDIERVDILRGPQGTLFGKNTQAGAINLSTKTFEDDYRPNQISGEWGNLGSRSIRGTTNISAFQGDLKNRLSIGYRERDGFIPDTLQNRDLGEMERISISDTVTYSPNAKTTVTLRLGWQQEKGTDPQFVARKTNPYPLAGQDIPPTYRTTLSTNSLRWEQQFKQFSLIGIHAFHFHRFHVLYDETDQYIIQSTPNPPPLTQINNPNRFFRNIQEYDRAQNHELRLQSIKNWTIGLNYSSNHYRLINTVDTQEFIPPFAGQPKLIHQNVRLKGNHFALFGEGNHALTSKLIATLGARYNYDKKTFNSFHRSQVVSAFIYNQESSQTYNDATARFALSYQWQDHLMLYSSIARGYRPGGYPTTQFNNYSNIATDQAAFLKSTSMTYDLGLKSEWFKRKLRSNLSLYLNDIKGNQARIRDSQTKLSYYENIDTLIYGLEWENNLRPHRDITLGLSATYTNGRFTEIKIIPEGIDIPKGAKTANTPTWSSATFVQYNPYNHFLKSYIGLRLAHRYVGERFGDNINRAKMPSYQIFDSRLFLENERFQLAFKVENLFDKTYESQAFYFGSIRTEVSSPGLPRLYALEASLRF